MSDYGLLTKNKNGGTQIDSTYRNLSLDESDTSESILFNNINGASVALTASPLVPLVAIRPSATRYVAIKGYHKTGSNFDAFLVHSEYHPWPFSAIDIDWKSYRENRNASGEDYGLLVYNASGELCFDNGLDYLKIREVHSITLNSPIYNNYLALVLDKKTITHSNYSNPYYILSRSTYWTITDPGGPPPYNLALLTIGVKKVSSTSVSVGWFITHTGGFIYRVYGGINPTVKLLVCE